MSLLPEFLILGAAKSGTTSLAQALMVSPSIFIPKSKELHYFDSEERYSEGINAYSSNFKDGEGLILGEATPSYLSEYEKVIPRVKASLSHDTKFIVILRNPVQRAWSHYCHMQRAQGEARDFLSLIEIDRERTTRVTSWENYFNDGLYSIQLENWFLHFPREQFLILKFDDLESNFTGVIQSVYDFLNVSDESPIEELHSNKRSVPRSQYLRNLINNRGLFRSILRLVLPRSLRQKAAKLIRKYNVRPLKENEKSILSHDDQLFLQNLYKDDITKLESLTGLNLDSWKKVVKPL